MEIRIKLKKLYTAAFAIACIAALLLAAASYAAHLTGGISDSAARSIAFEARLAQLEAEVAEQTGIIAGSSVSLSYDGISNTNELSRLSEQCGVSIRKLNELPEEARGGVIVSNIAVEVQGNLSSIIGFQRELQGGRAVIIKSISLRQNNDLLWLSRDFDNTRLLPWLEFGKAEDPVTPPELSPSNGSAAASNIPSLTQLFNHTDMLCYLQIEYLS